MSKNPIDDPSGDTLDQSLDAAIRRLPAELVPPPELELRTRAALGHRGLFAAGRAPHRWFRWLLAASLVAAFGGGVLVGRASGAPPRPTADEDPRPRFLLLLEEDAGYREAADPAARVAEYRAWARELAGAGHLVAAEKLSAVEERLPTAGRDGGPAATVTGYFLVRAADLDQARRLAAACPHLRHGGAVVVRPIEPT